MNLFEYQAKDILAAGGIPVPRSVVVKTPRDLAKIKDGLFRSGYVVKAQVAAGGRGKAGGVKLVKTAKEARVAAKALLGSMLTTHQTGGAGVKVESVLVAEKASIVKEYYLAIVLSRKRGQPVFLLSASGGMEIEEVAETNPSALIEVPIDPWLKAQSHHLRPAISVLGLTPDQANELIALARKLAVIYLSRDLFMLEINPLALTPKGFLAIDAKISFDENALFRQADNNSLAVSNEVLLGRLEKKAKKLGVAYVPVDGSIGCLVNGAGLAMATMDLIAGHGQRPANFLDVGGGANRDQVQGAFELLLADKKLKAILVNIFGGIMRCDLIAEALIEADKRVKLSVPLVARLLGNNVDQARSILAQAKLADVEVHGDLETAVRCVCAKVAGSGGADGYSGR